MIVALGGMRPVARPHQALGRGLHIGLRHRRDVGVAGRTDLAVDIGGRELDPRSPLVDQPADHGENRIINAGRLPRMGEMIEHHRYRQPHQHILDRDDLLGGGADLHVPAEIVHAFRQRLQHGDRGGARRIEHEAHAAHAETGEPLELGIGHAQVDHRDGACRGPERREGVERAAIVGAIGRGRHDHVAGGADPLLEQPIVLRARIDRMRPDTRRRREAAVVDVHMAIACVRRCLELGRLGAGRIWHRLRAARSKGEAGRGGRQRGHRGALEQGATCDHVVLPMWRRLSRHSRAV